MGQLGGKKEMLRFVAFLFWIFMEGKRLIRHPREFEGVAVIAWLLITAVGCVLLLNHHTAPFSLLLFAISIPVYYFTIVHQRKGRRKKRPGSSRQT
jgi:hypothetical protein